MIEKGDPAHVRPMESLLYDIIAALRKNPGVPLPDPVLSRLIRRHNKGIRDRSCQIKKRDILPFYLGLKQQQAAILSVWNLSAEEAALLAKTLTIKPRRSASGVATVTVLTRPWPCAGNCIYCPSDLAMPKSYLSDEPACSRALAADFNPYEQVSRRLRALAAMGHSTDKVELIILGGTFSDYPKSYCIWFVWQLLRALNEAPKNDPGNASDGPDVPNAANAPIQAAPRDAQRLEELQRQVDTGEISYNQAIRELWGTDLFPGSGPGSASGIGNIPDSTPCSTPETRLKEALLANESAPHRCVGLVIEVRPECITPEFCRFARSLGCTKIQMGIQSTIADVRRKNGRFTTDEEIERAFALLRLFGFKSHVHLMANLCGSAPEQDMADYRRLTHDPQYLPDEVKLYPCVLTKHSRLEELYAAGSWQPYSDEVLTSLLGKCLEITPRWTRVSRMMRDFTAHDILAGSKRVNLREDAQRSAEKSLEIRGREIGSALSGAEGSGLRLLETPYLTTVSTEYFLEFCDEKDHIAGFARLSLPRLEALEELIAACAETCPEAGSNAGSEAHQEPPFHPDEAMLRELHVYGYATALGDTGISAQHKGLGRALVARAKELARDAGYRRMNVISAPGTRAYYAALGFEDAGLYQRCILESAGSG